MFWMPLIMAGMTLAQGRTQQGQAKLQRKAEIQNAEWDNEIRISNNELAGARGALGRYTQSLRNQQHLKEYGKSIDAATENLVRVNDNYVSGNLERRIVAAEEAGAIAAQRGAAGVYGGTAQMLDATIALRQDRIQQQAKEEFKLQRKNLTDQRSSLVEGMILGMDDVAIVDDINYIPTIARQVNVPSNAAVFGQAALTFAQAYAQYGGGGSSAPAAAPAARMAPIDGYRFGPMGGSRSYGLA